jgi:UDP-N-acetylglucosamine--N-acetylmuramyl-(pentapeptide) pyrophosphoryl-undecaprenol N-acetylglucosamine transferase
LLPQWGQRSGRGFLGRKRGGPFVMVMITTGGSGGHVFPGLAVAAKLAARGAGVFWLGTRDGIESTLVPQHGVEFEGVSFHGVRGKGLRTLVFGPFALLGACLAARAVIRRRKPDVVLGFGGFASFPGGLMGTAAGKPLVLHDANAVAGLATRVLAYGADRILLGFPQALNGGHAKRVEWVGNPLRDSVCRLPAPSERFAGRGGPLRILVVGGSLGARGLNDLVPAALATLAPAERPQVVHQSGEKLIVQLRESYARYQVDAECVAFIDDMAARYAWADFVICRGGGLTVAELAAVGLGAIVVPLPGAIADEQSANAQFLVDAGAAWKEPQDQLTAARLAGIVKLLDRPRALAMAQAAYALGKRDAAERVAAVCAEVARR